MKKTIFFAFLLLVATAGVASEKLTLKLATGGPERGTLKAYQIIGVDEVNQSCRTHDSIAGNKILEITIKERNYFGIVYVVGQDFDQDRIIMASKGINNQKLEQPIEEEAGFSHWGFVKKYQIKTPVIIYSQLSKSPLIISVTKKITYNWKSNFHFGSIMALIILLSLGAEIGLMIFSFKSWRRRQWSVIRGLGNQLLGLIIWTSVTIYGVVWSYRVDGPFIYLGAAVILIGLTITATETIILKKKCQKNQPK
ncbi:MAG: hypothetical protein WC523_03310 [Patescibacteria group bacterium]|jgi:hypothetical protein